MDIKMIKENKEQIEMKCSMCKVNRCNSDYGNNIKCDGFNPPKKCPYKNTFGTSVGFVIK